MSIMCICSEVTYKLYNDSGIDGRCENWISSGALLDDGRVLAARCNAELCVGQSSAAVDESGVEGAGNLDSGSNGASGWAGSDGLQTSCPAGSGSLLRAAQ